MNAPFEIYSAREKSTSFRHVAYDIAYSLTFYTLAPYIDVNDVEFCDAVVANADCPIVVVEFRSVVVRSFFAVAYALV